MFPKSSWERRGYTTRGAPGRRENVGICDLLKLFIYREQRVQSGGLVLIAFLVPTLVRIRNLGFLFFTPISIEITFKTLLFFNAFKSKQNIHYPGLCPHLACDVRPDRDLLRWIVWSASLQPRRPPGSLGGNRCTGAPGSWTWSSTSSRSSPGLPRGRGWSRPTGGSFDPHPGGGVRPASVLK